MLAAFPRPGHSDETTWVAWILTLRTTGSGSTAVHWEAMYPPREYVAAAEYLQRALWRMDGRKIPVLDSILLPYRVRPIHREPSHD